MHIYITRMLRLTLIYVYVFLFISCNHTVERNIKIIIFCKSDVTLTLRKVKGKT